MEVEVSFVLHNNEPVKPEAVSVVEPQFSTTVTTGAAGMRLIITVKLHVFVFVQPSVIVQSTLVKPGLKTTEFKVVPLPVVAPVRV